MAAEISGLTVSGKVRRRIVDYPESDGEPIGETDFHIGAILYLRQALRWLFRHVEDVYVAANMFCYYKEGSRAARRAPDVFVVRGVPKHDRRVYKLWHERAVPCTIIEVTSKKSQVEDLGTKRGLYELLGVSEYLIFDPLGEYLEPRFQVFTLEGRFYRPEKLPDTGTYRSRCLGVVFEPRGAMLRVIDPESGQAVPDLTEAAEMAMDASRRAETEAHRAEQAERRAQAADQRADRLAARLRELGIDPDR